MQESADIAARFLPPCVLRVDVGGRPQGTGFMVAPGLAATCFHVIEDAVMAARTVPIALVRVRDDGTEEPYPVVRRHRLSDQDDLALLQLEGGEALPVALLDGAYRTLDKVTTYGFAEGHPEGGPTSLTTDGAMGGARRWLKFSGGQVQPGMSGSPVLNLETGAVCGILKRTRDESQPLGGYAIPMTSLFALDDELELANQRYADRHAEWLGALSASQRRGWRARRGVVVGQSAQSTQLIVIVGQQPDGWRVSARVDPPNGAASLTREANVDLTIVRTEVARLFGDWASRGRVPEGEQIRLLGTILFRALFPDEVSGCLEQLLKDHHDGQVHISLQFAHDTDPYLANLPWEDLYRPEEHARAPLAFAAAPNVSLSRVLLPEAEEDGGGPEPSERLSVLAMAVAPVPQRDAHADQVLDRRFSLDVADALEGLGRRDAGLHVQRLPSGTPEELRNALAEDDYDVLHYIGFGAFLGRDGDQVAVEADLSEGAEFFTIDELLLNWPSTPKLVVLQMCRGPSGYVPADFGMLAQAVLKRDVGAVVAWQHPLDADRHCEFNATFYQALMEGDSVQMAVQRGRQKLLGNRLTRAFVSPALFLREPRELRLVRPGVDTASRSEARSYAALRS